MDIIEAMQLRKSVRAFKPDAVPQAILKEVMELSLLAPSWGNSQPWELAIVSGQKMAEIKDAFIEKAEEPPAPDLIPPRDVPQPYNDRYRATGRKLFEIMGISRDDKARRRWWQLQGLRLFEAPSAIYIYIDRSFYAQGDMLNVWPILDCGLIAENIMLLATSYGLGTIPSMQAVFYPDILRGKLAIPDSKLLVLGIAIGYPDWDDPVNQFQSEREPLENLVKWYGFD